FFVYNSLGQQVFDSGDDYQTSGIKNFSFTGKNLASGIYYYQMHTEDKIFNSKFVLLK
ncbi:MAG: T9SS type A sorting domain-containing protein, partial [Candidatus Delongbacteria bacterium]|nr:T9SS type A sorting domain-containing protein [Candidatus Delongbacteria bacterium]